MDKKDIYDTFNDVNFDVRDFEEIPMNDIEKAKLKKELSEKLHINDRSKGNYGNELITNNIENKEKIISIKESGNKKNWKSKVKVLKVVGMAVVIAIVLGFSPMGKEVIAQIKEKLFFTPSYGILNANQWGDIYVLEDSKRVTINGESTLIKSIINSGDYISVEMWTNKQSSDKTEESKETMDNKIDSFRENFKLKTPTGDVLAIEGYDLASGGYSSFTFKQEGKLIIDFELYYGEEKIDNFSLKKVDFKNDYDEIGGNAMDKNILIGATSYYQEKERYFKIWSNREHEQFEDYTMSLDNINELEVSDDEGNLLTIESANDGTGRAYKIVDGYEGKLHINIKNVDLAYEMKEGTEVALKIPKDGQCNEVNKDVKLKGLDDKIKITTIKNNKGEYTVGLDYSNNYDKDRFVFMVSQSFRTGGAMGGQGDMIGESYFDKSDLSMKEKFFRKICFNIDRVQVNQKGNWEFTVE